MSILYKITTPEGKINYLFGTIHKNDDAFITLPLEVKEALESATYCVFEADFLSFENSEDLISELVNKWHQSQAEYVDELPEDYLLSARKYFKKMHANLIAQNPDMAAQLDSVKNDISLILPLALVYDMAGIKPIPDFLDQQLIRYAQSRPKRVCYLESAEEQLVVYLGLTFNFLEQIEIYQYAEQEIAKGNDSKVFHKEVASVYNQQDIQEMSSMLNRHATDSNAPEPYRQYYKRLGEDRDLLLASRMKPYLQKGNSFTAVGAAHLMGIVEALKEDGNIVEAVSLGKRHYSIEGSFEDGEKVAAFRKIYTALYMAQTSFFKIRGFISDDEMVVSLKQIQNYTSGNHHNRSFKAWELAQKHYKNISSENKELLKSICQEGYAKSSSFFGIFRQTKTNLDDAKSIKHASSDTRTGQVRDILNGQSI